MDQIYHLACPASPPHYQYNPIKTIKTSTMGTLNMLGLAKRVRARMLLTSTSEVSHTHTAGWTVRVMLGVKLEPEPLPFNPSASHTRSSSAWTLTLHLPC